MVLESLGRIQTHLLEAKDGATAVMISPPGETGLVMDDGSKIVYLDTMAFVFQKTVDGDGQARIIGTTIRSDLKINQARELIKNLTGQELPLTATAADCVRAISLANGGDGVRNATELVNIMQGIGDSQTDYGRIRHDLGRRRFLYNFDDQVDAIIQGFRDYVLTGFHSRLDMQKALAATFLKLSKYMLDNRRGLSNNLCGRNFFSYSHHLWTNNA